MAMPIIFLHTSIIPMDDSCLIKMGLEDYGDLELRVVGTNHAAWQQVFGLARLFQFFFWMTR